eukprot:SAG22_NODE_3833_length_1511_cov_1.981586_1_plen_125_part_00
MSYRRYTFSVEGFLDKCFKSATAAAPGLAHQQQQPLLQYAGFYIRINGKAVGEEDVPYINPVTWRRGKFFAPQLKQRRRDGHSSKAKVGSSVELGLPPPPVLLDREWEADNVEDFNKLLQVLMC